MSIRNLVSLFHPTSVAVIGASRRLHSVGETVLRNIIAARFHGAVFPMNPKYDELAGLKVYASVRHLPVAPDLAVICTPPLTVPDLIRELGERGTKAAIVLTAGLESIRDEQGRTLREAMLANAKPHLLRVLGPNCVGLLIPAIGLNASFAHTGALPGKLAFVSQSGGMVTGVLDWAKSRGIGFSAFISLGDSADVDVGDIVDYLASDSDTHAILMYIEEVQARQARKFMSAARAAARAKPVIVVKAGRVPEGAHAAASHTGALAGADDVYDAVFRRAGMLRVLSTDDLFGAVETLAHSRRLYGERLVVMTNGGGPGVMAVDALITAGGKLAPLSKETLHQLDAILPATWSHSNPVDMIGDAPVERYRQTMAALLNAPETDAILFIHAPTAIVPSLEIAEALAPLIQQAPRNVLACWLGTDSVAHARHLFSESDIPTYDTPEDAVAGFMQIVQYQRNQQLLIQAPPSLSDDPPPDRDRALEVIHAALADGRHMLSEPEAKTVLAAYRIPVVETRIAANLDEVLPCARQIGFPVAVKILSPDITHKSDIGGVALDLDTPEAAHAAAVAMQERLHKLQPDAHLQGFTVQRMARRPQAHELIAGIATDRVFGPVILFGQGGIAVETTADHALTLPPLNMLLARELISRTRVAKLLAGYRSRPAADVDAICRTLIQLVRLAVELPHIVELDINPLLADSQGVLALDARIGITPETVEGIDRLAIRSYPKELEQWVTWQEHPLLLRPIKPEDAAEHIAFFHAVNPEDVYSRMFASTRELSPAQLARFTQIDYEREMAFIATRVREDGSRETLGVARAVADPDNIEAEFAIVVRSDLKAQGLGHLLMAKLIDYCRNHGTERLVGDTLHYNQAMIDLAHHFGFDAQPSLEPALIRLRLDLAKATSRYAWRY